MHQSQYDTMARLMAKHFTRDSGKTVYDIGSMDVARRSSSSDRVFVAQIKITSRHGGHAGGTATGDGNGQFTFQL